MKIRQLSKNTINLFLIYTLILCLYSCEKNVHIRSVKLISSKNTFGDIDKKVIIKHEHVRYLVGNLINPNNAKCSATLVYKDLILTAAHYVSKDGVLTAKKE